MRTEFRNGLKRDRGLMHVFATIVSFMTIAP